MIQGSTPDLFNSAGIPFPKLFMRVSFPDVFVNKDRGRKMHKRVIRKAMTDGLEFHNRYLIPQHFGHENKNLYDHKKRTPITIHRKRIMYNTRVDLRKTGKSKTSILSQKPAVSWRRNIGDGIEHAFMKYKWPSNIKNRIRRPGKVDIFEMNDELTRWSDEDSKKVSRVIEVQFRNYYEEELANKGGKKYQRIIGPHLRNI